MENASKALIIAGAILLSILIISLGIVVVTNTRSTIDKANVNQTEVETFNSKITAYVGTGKTSQDVRNVCSTVLSINGAEATNQTGHGGIQINGAVRTTLPVATNMTNSQRFTINVETDGNGYVHNVTIDPNVYPATP